MFYQESSFWVLISFVVLIIAISTKGKFLLNSIVSYVDLQILQIKEKLSKSQSDLLSAKLELNKVNQWLSDTVLVANEVVLLAENQSSSLIEDYKKNVDKALRQKHQDAQEKMVEKIKKLEKEIKKEVAQFIISKVVDIIKVSSTTPDNDKKLGREQIDLISDILNKIPPLSEKDAQMNFDLGQRS